MGLSGSGARVRMPPERVLGSGCPSKQTRGDGTGACERRSEGEAGAGSEGVALSGGGAVQATQLGIGATQWWWQPRQQWLRARGRGAAAGAREQSRALARVDWGGDVVVREQRARHGVLE